MENVMVLVLSASLVAFTLGLGLLVGSDGEQHNLALVSGIMVIACAIWYWGFFCGQPAEEEESE